MNTQTGKQIDKQTDIDAFEHTNGQTFSCSNTQTGKQIDKRTDIHPFEHTNRQTNKQTDRNLAV